jgi:hypothetical protein
MPPKNSNEYKDLWDAINKIFTSQAKIETLLIGEEGSGLCGQVKELKEKKLSKTEMSLHLELHNKLESQTRWFIGTILTSVAILTTIVIFIITKIS